MEEGYVYRVRHADGSHEFLASISEVKDLLRNHDETNCVLGYFGGNPADGDDWYDFLREELAKLGIRMVRTVAEGYEEVLTLTEFEPERRLLFGNTGNLVPKRQKTVTDPDDLEETLDELGIGIINTKTISDAIRSTMYDADEHPFDTVLGNIDAYRRRALISGSWESTLLFACKQRNEDGVREGCVYLVDPEDSGLYAKFRAYKYLFAQTDKYRLTKAVRIKREEYDITLPIDIVNRYQQVTGNDVSPHHLETILERLLERSIEDGVKE